MQSIIFGIFQSAFLYGSFIATEVILKDTGEIDHYQTTTKHIKYKLFTHCSECNEYAFWYVDLHR